jgi:agmatine deiminase
MIPESEVNCVYLAAMLEGRHPKVFKGLRETLTAYGVQVRRLMDVRDVWVRDYTPIQVTARASVKFRYTPDYLRGHEHLITGEDVVEGFRDLGQCHRSEIILDGGNVVGCRGKAILTDKVYKENLGWDRPLLRRQLRELLQVDQLIIIPKEPYDPIGHADGMVRFIDERTVLVNDYSIVDPAFGDRLTGVLRQHKLRIETLPYFHEGRSSEGIPSAVGNYINLIQTDRVIVAPVYGVAQDETALAKLESLFGSVPIISLDGTDLAREGGVLHCVSASYHISPKIQPH